MQSYRGKYTVRVQGERTVLVLPPCVRVVSGVACVFSLGATVGIRVAGGALKDTDIGDVLQEAFVVTSPATTHATPRM